MGDNHTIKTKVYTRGWLEIDEDRPTSRSFNLDVKCPHCQTDMAIDEPMEFGHIYEFTCAQCKNLFVILVPDLVIKIGQIEGLIHGDKDT